MTDATRPVGPAAGHDPGRTWDPRPPRCKAPWAALYLDPRGEVKVCCQNEWLRLGSVRATSLGEIWRGEALEELRKRVAADDLSLGCEMCAVAVERGAEETAYFRSFEPLQVDPDHIEWPMQLDLALSNSCNLQCVMCNGELSSAIRLHREHRSPLPSVYGDRFFEELDEFLPHLQVVTFLGGEPFLAKEALRVMERLVELGLRPKCSVTTNGTQWSRRVQRLVETLPMHIAISVDAVTAPTLESIRVGVDHERVVANIGHFQEACRRSGGSVSFSSCLMLPNWREFGSVLQWADELDVDVFVNSVHHPPHLSFAHCHLDVLREVVRGLAEESTWRTERLGRNRQAWLDQIASATSLLSQRKDHGEGTLSEVPVALSSGARPRAAVLVADKRQLVQRVIPGPEQEFGLDLDQMQGRSLWELVHLATSSLGQLVRSDVHRDVHGGEQRRILFVHNEALTEMTLTMAPDAADGPTWFVGFADRSDENGHGASLNRGYR